MEVSVGERDLDTEVFGERAGEGNGNGRLPIAEVGAGHTQHERPRRKRFVVVESGAKVYFAQGLLEVGTGSGVNFHTERVHSAFVIEAATRLAKSRRRAVPAGSK